MCPSRALHRRGRPDPEAPQHEQAARCIQGMPISLSSLGLGMMANGTRSKPPRPSSTIPEDTPKHMREEAEAHNSSRYCVRPNSGRIEPGHEVEVSGRSLNPMSQLPMPKLTPSTSIVLLQAMKQDPPADAKSRDKFLVQSVLISGDLEFSNVQTIVSCPSLPIRQRVTRRH